MSPLVASGTKPAVAADAFDFASPSILPLTNGAASDTQLHYLPGGSYNLIANYGGDGIFGPSVSTPPIAVTVSAEPSTLILIIQDIAHPNKGATVTSVPYGTYRLRFRTALFHGAARGSSQTYALQATGTVTFSSTPAFAPLNQVVNINSNGFAEIPGQLGLAYPAGQVHSHRQLLRRRQLRQEHRHPRLHHHQEQCVDHFGEWQRRRNRGHRSRPQHRLRLRNLFTNSGTKLPSGTVTLTDSGGATVGTGTLAVVNTSNGPAAQATITVTGTATNISLFRGHQLQRGYGHWRGRRRRLPSRSAPRPLRSPCPTVDQTAR